MQTQCPHCGTEYDAEESEYGRFVKCAVCGKGFVAGTLTTRRRRTSVGVTTETAEPVARPSHAERVTMPNSQNMANGVQEGRGGRSARSQSLDFTTGSVDSVAEVVEHVPHQTSPIQRLLQRLASAPWTVLFSTIFLYVFGLLLALLTFFTSKPPSSFVQAVVLLAISAAVTFTLVRFNFVRWLLVVWGTFNLVVLICGAKDCAWAWPFHISFIVVAILLMLKPTHQWYGSGAEIDWGADIKSCQRISMLAAVLAVVAGVVLYFKYDSVRNRTRQQREDDYASSSTYRPSLSSDYTPPKSAEESIAGALANVKHRYKQNLSRLGLTESYYNETSGICDLMLLDVKNWTKYQIVYYRSTNYLEWPQMMPKDIAELLMSDRMMIDTYEKASGK